MGSEWDFLSIDDEFPEEYLLHIGRGTVKNKKFSKTYKYNYNKESNIMPTYKFKDINTGEIIEIFMKISELDEYKEKHPWQESLVNGSPMFCYGTIKPKPSERFKDILREIDKTTPGSVIKDNSSFI